MALDLDLKIGYEMIELGGEDGLRLKRGLEAQGWGRTSKKMVPGFSALVAEG
jgi:hypothetical protein